MFWHTVVLKMDDPEISVSLCGDYSDRWSGIGRRRIRPESLVNNYSQPDEKTPQSLQGHAQVLALAYRGPIR